MNIIKQIINEALEENLDKKRERVNKKLKNYHAKKQAKTARKIWDDEDAANKRRKEEKIDEVVSRVLNNYLYEGKRTNSKRKAVMMALKDPKYNHAQLAYALWPDMDKDTARSLFSKMATGTPDADGVVRHFSDEDINTLYSLVRKR